MYFFIDEPRKLVKEIDWGTIMFFIVMFIAMQGVWNSGVYEDFISRIMPARPFPGGAHRNFSHFYFAQSAAEQCPLCEAIHRIYEFSWVQQRRRRGLDFSDNIFNDRR